MPGWNGDLQSPGDGKLFEDVATWKLMAVLRKGYYLQQSRSRDSVLQGDKDENVYPLKVRGRILTTHTGSEKAHSIFVLLSRQMKHVWIWAFQLCVAVLPCKIPDLEKSPALCPFPSYLRWKTLSGFISRTRLWALNSEENIPSQQLDTSAPWMEDF